MSLPVPLSPFEHYMLMDDSRDYPMCFAIRLTIDKRLEHARFEQAVVATLQRHPLLNATISQVDQQLQWVAFNPLKQELLAPIVEWTDAESAEALQPINLRSTNGLRIVGYENSNSARVTFQIHHACCDGLGACQFIDDVLVAYHNSFADADRIEQRTIDTNSLKDRTNISRQRSKWTLPWRIGLGVARTVGFLVRQPIRLSGNRSDVRKNELKRNCSDSGFSPNVLTNLRRESSGQASVNDRLLAIAFHALFDWHEQFANRSKRRRMRIGIPVNLRGPVHRGLPAANVVSITFLDRTRSQVDDQGDLISGINRQMTGIKARKSGTFVRFMNFVGRSRQLRKLISSDRVFLSATFSNLGEIFVRSRLPRDEHGQIRFADAVLLDVDIQGPVRSTMPVFFAVFSYARRLQSCMAYDVNAFESNDALKLHHSFTSRIEAAVGLNQEPPIADNEQGVDSTSRRDSAFKEYTPNQSPHHLGSESQSQRSQ